MYGKNNDDFIHSIRKLKDNKQEYKKYVNKSKRIKKGYDEIVIYEKWLNLYKTISNK